MKYRLANIVRNLVAGTAIVGAMYGCEPVPANMAEVMSLNSKVCKAIKENYDFYTQSELSDRYIKFVKVDRTEVEIDCTYYNDHILADNISIAKPTKGQQKSWRVVDANFNGIDFIIRNERDIEIDKTNVDQENRIYADFLKRLIESKTLETPGEKSIHRHLED